MKCEPGVTIGELAETIRGVTYEKADARSSPHQGYSPLIRATNIAHGRLVLDSFVYVPDIVIRDDQRLRVGDIVLAASSGSLSVVGKAALLRSEWHGTFGAFCYVVRPRPGRVVPDYLAYFMQTSAYRGRVSKLAAGVNINNLRREHIESVELPYYTLAEQQRIVEGIDSYFTRLDNAVASLEKVQAKLKAYRASVLKAAVEGRLVPTEAFLARAEHRAYETADVLLASVLNERRRRWEEAALAKFKAAGKTPKDDKWKAKYQEPAAPDTSTLPRPPEGWCWATVEEISTKVVDGVHKKPDYVSSGVPFVTVKNLTAGAGIDFENLKHITVEDHETFIARANPERGDLLVSKDGTLGVIRAVRTDRVFSIFVSVAMIKPVLISMSDYLELALSSPSVQVQMVPKGSGLQHIHLEDLRRDCVPIPPISEQTRILETAQRYVSVADWVEETVTRNLARLARLRQAVLKWAFEGKLADQDPTDKPADHLLARIIADRAAALATKTGRRTAKGAT
jgi:type I restriction enzyme S subunit